MTERCFDLLDKLYQTQTLSAEEYAALIDNHKDKTVAEYLFTLSGKRREEYYQKDVYIRGLIEFTNYCKNDCYYCGIRNSNRKAVRYRLSEKDILHCCEEGYALGFRTFVLQGGEDPYFKDERLCQIVSEIKKHYSDCAVTLSIGEKSHESYQRLFDAGADRYLLRHETADFSHYAMLHPKNLSAENRQRCIMDLKAIGYQVGTGFMVGSPFQTTENLVADMLFLKSVQPSMVGIGPFISHKDTPFSDKESGTLELTLFMIGLIRLTLPYALIPSTTALGTISPFGRELGLKAGANVIMPNLSPTSVRPKYMLYDNKICTGEESAQCLECLKNRVKNAGYQVVVARGDVYGTEPQKNKL